MKERTKTIIYLVISIVILALIIGAGIFSYLQLTTKSQFEKAPDFAAVDQNGATVTLSEFNGSIVLIHITNIENPICLECEKELKAQVKELEKFQKDNPEVAVITINMRRSVFSDPGDKLAKEWWGVNISWYWIEDFDPYPIASKFLEYWNLDGGTANPTLILIDKDQTVVGVYHVYQMGKGEIDGIQDAEDLESKVEKLEKGEWNEFEGTVSSQGANILTMFVLGVITSISPCSIALLVAMFSYMMGAREKGDDREKDEKERSFTRDGLITGVAFTLGMALVFGFVGLLLSFIGGLIRLSSIFYLLAGIVMIVLGINNIKPWSEMLSPLYEPIIRSIRRKTGRKGRREKGFKETLMDRNKSVFDKSVFIGAFILGVLFSLAWAPCAVSLVFPVVIWMISQDVGVLMGGVLLFIFGLGHGVPVIPLATFTTTARGKLGGKYIQLGKKIVYIFGIVVIIFGIVFIARYFGFYLW
jgi:cytochrome c-type biogenesis protein